MDGNVLELQRMVREVWTFVWRSNVEWYLFRGEDTDDRALPGTLAQLQTGEDGDIWDENKTEDCGAPHLASLSVSASPHWRHPGAFNLITGGNVAVTGIVVWSPSHPWRIFQVIILHGVLISLPSSNYMKEQWNIKKLWDIIRGKNWQKQWCSFIATVMAIEEDPWRHWAVLSARARVTNCGGREVVVKKMCRCRSVGPRAHGPRRPPTAPPSAALHRPCYDLWQPPPPAVSNTLLFMFTLHDVCQMSINKTQKILTLCFDI